jgi:hypothetical protein
VVQASPSSQAAVLSVFAQPVALSQLSSVQPLASSQSSAFPPTQDPLIHWSATVQASPSSQLPAVAAFTQPLAGLQKSSVQEFPSSQSWAEVSTPAHEPAAQTSSVVQALPSSQAVVLSVLEQPVALLQTSSVQPFPSLQSGAAPPTQTPAEQVSDVVQASPSSQATATLVFSQPWAVSQVSAVQTLPSSQSGAAPPTQLPAEQVSLVVQALPSLQAAVLSVFAQPVALSQLSSVQPFWSSQLGGAPPTQTPAWQVSLVVQASPSSQAKPLSW